MNLPDSKELKKLTKFCRDNGIQTLKHGEFEINFASSALFPKEDVKQDDEKITTEGSFTDEQALYWSVTGIDPALDGKEAT